MDTKGVKYHVRSSPRIGTPTREGVHTKRSTRHLLSWEGPSEKLRIPTWKVGSCDPHRNYKVSDWNRSSPKGLRHHHFQHLLLSSSNGTSPNLHHHQHYFAWSFIIIIVPPSSLSLSSSIGIILHHDFGEDWFRSLTFLVPMGVIEGVGVRKRVFEDS